MSTTSTAGINREVERRTRYAAMQEAAPMIGINKQEWHRLYARGLVELLGTGHVVDKARAKIDYRLAHRSGASDFQSFYSILRDQTNVDDANYVFDALTSLQRVEYVNWVMHQLDDATRGADEDEDEDEDPFNYKNALDSLLAYQAHASKRMDEQAVKRKEKRQGAK